MTFLYNTFYFFVAIAILVTFHEYGHFVVARLLGIKVLKFSVGFGKVLFSWTGKKGTEYCLSAIPVGGYVKMLDEFEEAVAPEDVPYAFNRQPVWIRSLVVFAGPAFNILFAFLVYFGLFMVGVNRIMPVVGHVYENSVAAKAGIHVNHRIVEVNNEKTIGWSEVSEKILDAYAHDPRIPITVQEMGSESTFHTTLDLSSLKMKAKANILHSIGLQPVLPKIPNVIENVVEGSPADRAGVKVGDKILKIGNDSVKSWNDMIRYIRVHPDVKEYKLLLGRGEGTVEVTIVPKKRKLPGGNKIPIMGIQSAVAHFTDDMLTVERYLPWNAFMPALERTVEITWLTAKLLAKLLTAQVSIHAVTGPVGIAITAGKAASSGIADFFQFLAMISISLAIINLVPLPVLDGGHLLFYLIETVLRRPLSVKVQRFAIEMGLYLVIGLMVVVSINDIIVKALH